MIIDTSGVGKHVVQYDSSSNVVFDFVAMHFQCVIDDTSFEAQSLMDFVDLDLSGSIESSPLFVSNVMDDSSFSGIDSKAMLYVPIDLFQNMFMVNIKNDQDLNGNVDDEDELNKFRFALNTDSWNQTATTYTIPFHNSHVDASFALNPNSKRTKQNIQNDFIRSIYFDITGSLKFSSLFNNSNTLLNNMKSLDVPLTSHFTSILNAVGGTMDNPLLNTDISNNPSRDFLFGILNAPEDKTYRKQALLDDLASAKNAQWIQFLSHKYYIHGLSFKGYGYYYPVYMTHKHPDLYIGYKKIRFPQFGSMDFYVNVITLHMETTDANIPSNYFEYQSKVHDAFVSLPIRYGENNLSSQK